MHIPLLLMAISGYAFLLSILAYSNRHVHLGRPVTLMMAGIAIAAAGLASMMFVDDRTLMYASAMVSNLGYAILVLSLGGLVYSYRMGGCPTDNRVMLALAAVPIFMVVSSLTDPWTGFYYSSVEVSQFQGWSYLELLPSWGFLVVLGYALVLLSALLILITKSVLGATDVNIRHMAVITVAVVVAFSVSIITEPVTDTPPGIIEIISLAAVAYPVYAVTFRSGISSWSLSYREVLDISTDMKVIIDKECRPVFHNRPGAEIVPNGIIRPELMDLVKEAAQSDRILTKEFELSGNTHEGSFLFKSVPIFSRRGSRMGTLINARDVTELTLQRKALSEVNEKVKLISGLSRHDIIKQLTVISGLLFILREKAEGDARASSMVDSIERATEVIHRQLLFMNDYEMIGISEPIWMSLHATIASAARNNDLDDVEIKAEFDDIEVLADPLLEKVFTNLIHNSLVHGKDLEWISFTTEYDDGALLVHYRDNGGGIAPEYRDGLFDKGVGKNTGLGLFLSRNILEITGMRIDEVGVYGQGVDFVIRVPAGNHRPVS